MQIPMLYYFQPVTVEMNGVACTYNQAMPFNPLIYNYRIHWLNHLTGIEGVFPDAHCYTDARDIVRELSPRFPMTTYVLESCQITHFHPDYSRILEEIKQREQTQVLSVQVKYDEESEAQEGEESTEQDPENEEQQDYEAEETLTHLTCDSE